MGDEIDPRAAYPLIDLAMADDDANGLSAQDLSMKRDDVVIVEFPCTDGGRGKKSARARDSD
jgi:hypothetical protein